MQYKRINMNNNNEETKAHAKSSAKRTIIHKAFVRMNSKAILAFARESHSARGRGSVALVDRELPDYDLDAVEPVEIELFYIDKQDIEMMPNHPMTTKLKEKIEVYNPSWMYVFTVIAPNGLSIYTVGNPAQLMGNNDIE